MIHRGIVPKEGSLPLCAPHQGRGDLQGGSVRAPGRSEQRPEEACAQKRLNPRWLRRWRGPMSHRTMETVKPENAELGSPLSLQKGAPPPAPCA